MFRPFAKLLLTATSLAPVSGAFAIAAITKGRYSIAVSYVTVAVALLFICWALMKYAAKYHQVTPLHIAKIKSTDKEVFAFLIAYLLPLFAAGDTVSEIGSVVTVYVVVVVFATVYHSNAFVFNPMLSWLSYHFYEVESTDGMTLLLITRRTIRKQKLDISTVELTEYAFLEIDRRP